MIVMTKHRDLEQQNQEQKGEATTLTGKSGGQPAKVQRPTSRARGSFAVSSAMATARRIDRVLAIQKIKPNPRNAHTHSKAQIQQIAGSIKAFGFGAPVLVDETLTLLAGHGRVKAAESINIPQIPAVQLLGLTDAQKRALALADNKIGDNAGWDGERLAIELPELAELLLKEKIGHLAHRLQPGRSRPIANRFRRRLYEPRRRDRQRLANGPCGQPTR